MNTKDEQPFHLNEVTIEPATKYVYLGTPITCESITHQVNMHIKMKMSHTLKFSSFIYKNWDAPFIVKEKVWKSALNSAMFYGCETWLCNNTKTAEATYSTTLKLLLGVRNTTNNNIACVEANVSSAKAFIKDRQSRFLKKLLQRDGYIDTQLHHFIELAKQVKSPMGVYLINLDIYANHSDSWLSNVKIEIANATSTRYQTYVTINPTLLPSPLYKDPSVPEYARVACTRLRLSSHRLRIETGRWARIPRENRTCRCGNAVQTEEHVLLSCPDSAHIRAMYLPATDCDNIAELFDNAANKHELSVYCYNILDYFK